MRYLLILCLLLSSSSCAIPIKITTYKNSFEIDKEEKAEKKLLRKEKYDKIYNKAMKRLARKIADKKKPQKTVQLKKTRIMINTKDTMIHAIMAESGLSEPKAVIIWERYTNRPEVKSFVDFLIELNLDRLQDKYYIEFVERVKARTKMIKKEYLKKNEYQPRFTGKTLGIIVEDKYTK